MNNDRQQIWSEAHRSYDDIMHSHGDENSDLVDDKIVKKGIVLLCNCQHCGRQCKTVMSWIEVAQLYLGEPVAGTAPTRDGVKVAVQCVCSADARHATPLIVDWDEVRRYVDIGVRVGALRPNIYDAAKGR